MDVADLPIDITTRNHGSWAVMVVRGDLDIGTADHLERAVDEHAGTSIALDLSGIDFIDSSGLRSLLSVRKRGTPPVLIAPSDPVTNLLELTMLTDAFPVVGDASELDGS